MDFKSIRIEPLSARYAAQLREMLHAQASRHAATQAETTRAANSRPDRTDRVNPVRVSASSANTRSPDAKTSPGAQSSQDAGNDLPTGRTRQVDQRV